MSEFEKKIIEELDSINFSLDKIAKILEKMERRQRLEG